MAVINSPAPETNSSQEIRFPGWRVTTTAPRKLRKVGRATTATFSHVLCVLAHCPPSTKTTANTAAKPTSAVQIHASLDRTQLTIVASSSLIDTNRRYETATNPSITAHMSARILPDMGCLTRMIWLSVSVP